MTALPVADRTDAEDSGVPAVTPAATARRRTVGSDPSPLSPPASAGTEQIPDGEPSGADGSELGKSGSASSSPTSGNSVAPLNISSGRWRKPRNVKQFAAQINEIATMVLNGQIDLDQARVYSGLARTVAQSISLEVSRARFLRTVPDLRLDEEIDDLA